MEIFIVVVLVLMLLTLGYLLSVGLKLSNAIASSNSKALAELKASTDRIEAAAQIVAQDLSDAHARADAVLGDNHGEAADAASQQTEREKMANHNPKH